MHRMDTLISSGGEAIITFLSRSSHVTLTPNITYISGTLLYWCTHCSVYNANFAFIQLMLGQERCEGCFFEVLFIACGKQILVRTLSAMLTFTASRMFALLQIPMTGIIGKDWDMHVVTLALSGRVNPPVVWELFFVASLKYISRFCNQKKHIYFTLYYTVKPVLWNWGSYSHWDSINALPFSCSPFSNGAGTSKLSFRQTVIFSQDDLDQ